MWEDPAHHRQHHSLGRGSWIGCKWRKLSWLLKAHVCSFLSALDWSHYDILAWRAVTWLWARINPFSPNALCQGILSQPQKWDWNRGLNRTDSVRKTLIWWSFVFIPFKIYSNFSLRFPLTHEFRSTVPKYLGISQESLLLTSNLIPLWWEHVFNDLNLFQLTETYFMVRIWPILVTVPGHLKSLHILLFWDGIIY